MTLGSSDLQSDSDMDIIRNSCDVFCFKIMSTFHSEHIPFKMQWNKHAIWPYFDFFNLSNAEILIQPQNLIN